MNRYSLFFLLGGVVFGGQSIQLSTATASNTSVPAQPVGNPWRIEFSIHDWDANAGPGYPMDASAVGGSIQLQNLGSGSLLLLVFSNRATGGSVCQTMISSLPTKFITFRFQEDPVAKFDYCRRGISTAI